MSATSISARPPLDLSAKLSYGVGSVAYGAKLHIFGLLLFFYNQLLGLPAHWVSVALATSVVIDAFFDPALGQLSDNTRSRLGRRHPYMFFAALPVALCIFALWHPPEGWAPVSLFAYMAVLAIAARLLISLYEIPNTALVAELSYDYDSRTGLLSYRYFFLSMGRAAALMLAYFVFLRSQGGQPGQFRAEGYGPYASVVAIIVFASIMVSSLGTRRFIPYLRAPPKRRVGLGEILREMAGTISNRNLVVLAISGLLFGITQGLIGGLNIYFSTYLWGLKSEQIGLIGMAVLISAPIGAVLAPQIAKRFGKKASCLTLFFISIFVLAAPLTAKLLDIMPPSGSLFLVALLTLDGVIVGVLSIMGFIIVSSMIADIAEENEVRTGRRSEGLLFSADSFLQKVSAGMATALPGLLITYVGLPARARPATVDPSIMIHLAQIYLPLIIGLMLCSTSCIFFYRIDRKAHEDNLRQLADSVARLETLDETLEAPADPESIARPA